MWPGICSDLVKHYCGFGFTNNGLLLGFLTTSNKIFPPASWSTRSRPWCRLTLVIGAIFVVADGEGALERAFGPRAKGFVLGLG